MSYISQNAALIPITPFGSVAGPDVQQALQQIAVGATGGTVTSVSVATANGVSGVVSNPTTTPDLTLTLGDITPSTILCNGNSSPLPSISPTQRLQVGGADGSASGILIDAFATNPTLFFRRANNTNASKSALSSGVAFAAFTGRGYKTTTYSGDAAAFTANSTEAWTDTATGCHIRLATTPNGSTTRVNSLIISDTSVAALGAITGSNLSGTNTGDQLTFKTFSVAGQSDIVADSATDTLTVVAGTNTTITTDASTDSLTINALSTGAAGLNGQVVTYGTLNGPGAAAIQTRKWLPITVDGVAYFIPLLGV